MTELGGLSQCMVEGDSESLARARRLRRKALAVSVVAQVICVTAILVWPLLAAPGALPPRFILTPLPPYHAGGGAESRMRHTNVRPRPARPILAGPLVYHPVESRRPVRELSGEAAPDLGTVVGDFGTDSEGPAGLGIPGGVGDGQTFQPSRPAAPVRPAIRKVSEGVMAGALVHRVDPVYPVIARNMRLSGTVRLSAIIATDGSVQSLEVLSGNAILARAAVAAVRQWQYRPTRLNGVPVEVETYITVSFVLSQ